MALRAVSNSATVEYGAGEGSVSFPPLHWSSNVALDPKHRPQVPHRPATTVRREWWRWPQEAHLVDSVRGAYRRLNEHEIAGLQGFDPEWFNVPGLSPLDKIRAIGDAVPPPLASAVLSKLDAHFALQHRTSVEVCAGSGGIADAAARTGLEHKLLVDYWNVSTQILKHKKPWEPECVRTRDVRSIDFTAFAGTIGLLSGGPPCQPWSAGGHRLGHADERDLLGSVHEVVGDMVPEAFVFENVPGLLMQSNSGYLAQLVGRLSRPAPGLRYGVAVGQLNAADFGVPQRRRRLFVIGVRDAKAAAVFDMFDDLEESASHRDPRRELQGRQAWRTVSAILDPEPHNSWRAWPFGSAVDG